MTIKFSFRVFLFLFFLVFSTKSFSDIYYFTSGDLISSSLESLCADIIPPDSTLTSISRFYLGEGANNTCIYDRPPWGPGYVYYDILQCDSGMSYDDSTNQCESDTPPPIPPPPADSVCQDKFFNNETHDSFSQSSSYSFPQFICDSATNCIVALNYSPDQSLKDSQFAATGYVGATYIYNGSSCSGFLYGDQLGVSEPDQSGTENLVVCPYHSIVDTSTGATCPLTDYEDCDIGQSINCLDNDCPSGQIDGDPLTPGAQCVSELLNTGPISGPDPSSSFQNCIIDQNGNGLCLDPDNLPDPNCGYVNNVYTCADTPQNCGYVNNEYVCVPVSGTGTGGTGTGTGDGTGTGGTGTGTGDGTGTGGTGTGTGTGTGDQQPTEQGNCNPDDAGCLTPISQADINSASSSVSTAASNFNSNLPGVVSTALSGISVVMDNPALRTIAGRVALFIPDISVQCHGYDLPVSASNINFVLVLPFCHFDGLKAIIEWVIYALTALYLYNLALSIALVRP